MAHISINIEILLDRVLINLILHFNYPESFIIIIFYFDKLKFLLQHFRLKELHLIKFYFIYP